MIFKDVPLRTSRSSRRALMIFKDVNLRTRRALSVFSPEIFLHLVQNEQMSVG